LSLERLLATARARLRRLTPAQAAQAMQTGAVVVDIRSDSHRERDGHVPGAVFIPRNVLEWRCAPDSEWRDARVSDPARPLVLMCDEGYQSVLAAATLQDLGLPLATDLIGGFRAWRAEGLPVTRETYDASRDGDHGDPPR
jgi:rhodanese-related sulfurtransferase